MPEDDGKTLEQRVLEQFSAAPVPDLLARLIDLGRERPGEAVAALFAGLATMHAMLNELSVSYGGPRVGVASFLESCITSIESGIVNRG